MIRDNKKTMNNKMSNKLLNNGKQLRNKILLNVAIQFYSELQVGTRWNENTL